MRWASKIVIVAALLLASCADRPKPAPVFDRESERRAVIRVVLMERYVDVTREYGEREAGRFVLDPVLGRGFPQSLPDERRIARLREKGRWWPVPRERQDGRLRRALVHPGLAAGLIADWAAHAVQSPTPKDLDVPLPVVWFTADDWRALKGAVITGRGAWRPPRGQAFRLKYPDTAGWIQLSDVGFSPDGDQALVHADVWHGPDCSYGEWLLLERRDGQWTIVAQRGSWIS